MGLGQGVALSKPAEAGRHERRAGLRARRGILEAETREGLSGCEVSRAAGHSAWLRAGGSCRGGPPTSFLAAVGRGVWVIVGRPA